MSERGRVCATVSDAYHVRKFADLGTWSSYKEPLKRFIVRYDGDEGYYLNKQKVGSLNHGVDDPTCLSEHVYAMLGILVDEAETKEQARCAGLEPEPWPQRQYRHDDDGAALQPDPAKAGGAAGGIEAAAAVPCAAGGARVRSLRWGATSMRECAGLSVLLEPSFLALVTGQGTGATRQVEVDPWTGTSHTSSPQQASPAIRVEVSAGPQDAFESGPGAEFAAGDERQRRSFNPVTAATLVGKCACLLPPDLVRGRSVLDLGAWYLFPKVDSRVNPHGVCAGN